MDTAAGGPRSGLALMRHVFCVLVALLLFLPSGAASACLEVAEAHGAEESESGSCARSALLRGDSQAEGAGPPTPDLDKAPATLGLFDWRRDLDARPGRVKEPCPIHQTMTKRCPKDSACLGPRGPPLLF